MADSLWFYGGCILIVILAITTLGLPLYLIAILLVVILFIGLLTIGLFALLFLLRWLVAALRPPIE